MEIRFDVVDAEMFNGMVGLLRIPRVNHRVEELKPPPVLGGPFDLISAFSIISELHSTDDIRGAVEQVYFLRDCRCHLRPGGRVPLDFIPEDIAMALRQFPDGALAQHRETFTRTNPAGAGVPRPDHGPNRGHPGIPGNGEHDDRCPSRN